MVQKKIGFQNFVWSEKIQVPKNFRSKKLWVQKYYRYASLPYSIGLSKVGWIGRGVGVGMGVPFLGFNVAYIPNLSLLQSLEPFEKGSKI